MTHLSHQGHVPTRGGTLPGWALLLFFAWSLILCKVPSVGVWPGPSYLASGLPMCNAHGLISQSLCKNKSKEGDEIHLQLTRHLFSSKYIWVLNSNAGSDSGTDPDLWRVSIWGS